MMGPRFEHLRFIHRAWRYRIGHERSAIHFLFDHLRPGDVAIDIGAYKGAFTYWMQRCVGPRGRVFAFDPQPMLAEYLRVMMQRSVRAGCTVVENRALSSTAGERTLHVPGQGNSPGASLMNRGNSSKHTYTVPVDTLDGYLARTNVTSVRLIKCDVEGHELEVFQGASGVLSAHRPALIFECEARWREDAQVGTVFSFLTTLGYEGWSLEPRGRRRPIREFDPAVHQRLGHGAYINNFLFTAA